MIDIIFTILNWIPMSQIKNWVKDQKQKRVDRGAFKMSYEIYHDKEYNIGYGKDEEVPSYRKKGFDVPIRTPLNEMLKSNNSTEYGYAQKILVNMKNMAYSFGVNDYNVSKIIEKINQEQAKYVAVKPKLIDKTLSEEKQPIVNNYILNSNFQQVKGSINIGSNNRK